MPVAKYFDIFENKKGLVQLRTNPLQGFL